MTGQLTDIGPLPPLIDAITTVGYSGPTKESLCSNGVQDGLTGALFNDNTPTALAESARRAAPLAGDVCRTSALRFSESIFDNAMEAQVRSLLRLTRTDKR